MTLREPTPWPHEITNCQSVHTNPISVLKSHFFFKLNSDYNSSDEDGGGDGGSANLSLKKAKMEFILQYEVISCCV